MGRREGYAKHPTAHRIVPHSEERSGPKCECIKVEKPYSKTNIITSFTCVSDSQCLWSSYASPVRLGRCQREGLLGRPWSGHESKRPVTQCSQWPGEQLTLTKPLKRTHQPIEVYPLLDRAKSGPLLDNWILGILARTKLQLQTCIFAKPGLSPGDNPLD